nr:hypothetical protein [Tanacetum cinerariifolium]
MTWPQLLPYVSWPVQLLLSRGYGINDYPTSTSTSSTTLPKMILSPIYQSLNMLKNIFVPLVSKEKAKEPLTHQNLFRIQSSDFICFIWIYVVQCELQALMVNDLSDDTTPSVARKFLNEVKSSLVTLQRVVKQKMTLEVHNWSSSAHKEVHKIISHEIAPW